MPKAEKGSAKDLANKSKAKGLQKLRFYCQMCQKQCRDANGFKCHLTAESHLANMKIFANSASGMLDNFSQDFLKMYMDTLRRRHGTKKVNANNVYQEVIADKHHVHMNATKWSSLSVFCQYLGKTGKCVVEETERGWYVSYIERDVGILDRQAAQQRRVEAEQRAESRFAKQMELQRTEASKLQSSQKEEATVMDTTTSVSVALSLTSTKKQVASSAAKVNVFGDDDDDDDEEEEVRLPAASLPPPPASKKRPRDYDGKSSNKSSHHDDRTEHWLRRDILVRIISKKLGKYYKRKAVVDKVLDKFTAEVELLDSSPTARDGGDVIRIDQDDLETVVPKEGKKVRILNGKGRGKKAIVVSLNPGKYKATLELLDDGTVLNKVNYEDFSKLAT